LFHLKGGLAIFVFCVFMAYNTGTMAEKIASPVTEGDRNLHLARLYVSALDGNESAAEELSSFAFGGQPIAKEMVKALEQKNPPASGVSSVSTSSGNRT
jgi:hypothetical protein